MENHPRKERSLVFIKPDGVQRGLIGEIIKRFERTGLKMITLKMMLLDADRCWKHYNKDEAWFEKKGTRIIEDRKANNLPIEKDAIGYGKEIVEALVRFMTSGPVVGMIWEGNKATGIVTKIVGTTEPLTSDVGTIRGDLTLDSYEITSIDGRAVRNLIHCSESPAEAEREIALWFKGEDIINYRLVQEQILYDVNLDGILE
jgi:nucleoside-diphosphate kinase